MVRMIKFFDTTLRDGEQTPGVNLNIKEKMEIAKQLSILGVDVIEAGFANASNGDFEAIRNVAQVVKDSSVASLCRTVPADIDRAWEAVKDAVEPRIHTFIATSDIHMQYKLKMTRAEVLEQTISGVKRAKQYCSNVEFSAEDASRTDRDFLYQIVEAAIAAGATTVNIPDTVGYIVPREFSEMIQAIREHVPNIDLVDISVHCHNDLGMATANSLAAIEAGANQVECTINGLGERAGNASLEEILMALKTRHDYYDQYDLRTRIKNTEIITTSRLVSSYTGLDIPTNKPIVGANAFLHASGIHQHGVLNNAQTYEIMTPESVGIYDNDNIVLGKLSGHHAFDEKLKSMGYNLDKDQSTKLFAQFKALADRKKDINIKDVIALVEGRVSEVEGRVSLENYQIFSTSKSHVTATISLAINGEIVRETGVGEGPVDAAFNAIAVILGMEISLESYALKAITGGTDALGEVTTRVKYQDKIYLGKGISTDIIESSIFAYLNSINRIIIENKITLSSAVRSK